MKRLTTFVFLLFLFIEVPSALAQSPDYILYNARIKTGSGWEEAMAIKKGVIIAVGDTDSIRSMSTASTRTRDLDGKTVLPGLFDSHVHPLYGGISQVVCNIPQGSNLEQTLSIVKACADNASEGEWVTGGQWDASALGQTPHRSMLDAIAPNVPILLNDTSGHSGWANSRALEIANITRHVQDPEGGIIERDIEGNPSGVLRELAVFLVRRHVPPHPDKTIRTALTWSMETMLSYGITSFTEASTGFVAGIEREVKMYAQMADEGLIKQRTRLCLTWSPDNPEFEAVVSARNLYARENVKTDCIKIFLDGVPTDSHTGAMLEPYADSVEGRSDDAYLRGMLLVEQELLNEVVTHFDQMGLTIKFHAAGDAAVRAGLNAIEAARVSNGFSGLLHNVGHCTFIDPEDLPRARNIGATLEMSPYLWSPSPINDDITAAVGEERIKRVWPVREAIEAGALVVPGSDWSVVPSVNPWIAIEALVTRESPGGSERSFGKSQAITIEQAIDIFTINAARHAGASDKLGRIEVGMLADVIILDRNPYEIPVTELHKVEVMMTMINGEIVYER